MSGPSPVNCKTKVEARAAPDPGGVFRELPSGKRGGPALTMAVLPFSLGKIVVEPPGPTFIGSTGMGLN
jgi:hypothetical protein